MTTSTILLFIAAGLCGVSSALLADYLQDRSIINRGQMEQIWPGLQLALYALVALAAGFAAGGL